MAASSSPASSMSPSSSSSSSSPSSFSSIHAIIGKNPQIPLRMFSKESAQKGIDWQPKPTDIIITTAPKTGTTLLQQLCLQIIQPGFEDFEDLYQVSPWILLAYDLGQEIDELPLSDPRILKSHQLLSAVNSGGKYIVTLRDPLATMLSYYNFLKEKKILVGDVNGYAQSDMWLQDLGFGAHVWAYYIEFWKCRHHPDVLMIIYEDLAADIGGHIDQIAKFMNVTPLSESAKETVLRHCTKQYMMQHSSKFDESWVHEQAKRIGRMDWEHFLPAVRVTLGHKDVVSDATRALLNERWKELVTPHTGHATYEEMCDEWRAEMRKME